MKVFISHNKTDVPIARLLAMALIQQGVGVWFDEWSIRPGDSLTGGIEAGLGEAEIFVLIWSEQAAKSRWVGTEVKAYLRRRVENDSLRIVPVVTDSTPLPILVADYKGFYLNQVPDLNEIAAAIVGHPIDREVARLLQERLLELTDGLYAGYDPFPLVVCPKCGSPSLKRSEAWDRARGDRYLTIKCEDCEWEDATEL